MSKAAFDLSQSQGDAVLALLERARVPPLPAFYRLFFDYVAGAKGLMAERVGTVLTDGKGAVGERLYTEFIAPYENSEALDQALGDRAGIRRYGSSTVPMDEACAECSLDISGRALSVFRGEIPVTSIANYETELTEEFFRAVAGGAKMTLHIDIRYGSNVHHMIEAAFKAFARALRVAISIDPEEKGVPSTKGTLSG